MGFVCYVDDRAAAMVTAQTRLAGHVGTSGRRPLYVPASLVRWCCAYCNTAPLRLTV